MNPSESTHERIGQLNLKEKTAILMRLNRIEGQIRGVKGQVERNEYCDHVLNQMSAIHSALNAVGRLLLENHLKTHVRSRVKQTNESLLDEVLETLTILMK
ncbi:metal-sensitive transcriptional regulator [Brevibacillus agri]|nr:MULTISPECIES: metal-sensitive transcriptional regulator [Brevibacillus]MED1645893.1 metal-sensitive transcriptional regulator [Brevibacillus agri]MED1657590.1 metal-sensitive transcriptional regulator [Brevibacillus agri]MED1690082.1 metal-sensitive transcriptional regulator [Brevibacillus agri]MED1694001.1 metal-sensitive transcriptional regulator [Brevibacillus agri]MED1699908.1 metal-sensitive transcriptional regulator [Brevibacillus agri]